MIKGQYQFFYVEVYLAVINKVSISYMICSLCLYYTIYFTQLATIILVYIIVANCVSLISFINYYTSIYTSIIVANCVSDIVS